MSNQDIIQLNTTVKSRYTINKLLGKGGMSWTYVAHDNELNSEVVLKVLYLNDVKEWHDLELYEREINVLKNLNHSNIPDYIDNFEIEINGKNVLILVQKYIKGKTLKQLVKEDYTFTFEEVKSITLQLLGILNYIHNIQPCVIHRDINPNNVIIDENKNVHLIDFGAAGYVAKSTLSAAMSKTFVGTIGYMPEDQLFGKSSPSNDIYSLGATVLFLLSGKHPVELSDYKGRLKFASKIKVPKYFKKIIESITEQNTKYRPKDAGTIINLIKNKKYTKKESTKVYGIFSEKIFNMLNSYFFKIIIGIEIAFTIFIVGFFWGFNKTNVSILTLVTLNIIYFFIIIYKRKTKLTPFFYVNDKPSIYAKIFDKIVDTVFIKIERLFLHLLYNNKAVGFILFLVTNTITFLYFFNVINFEIWYQLMLMFNLGYIPAVFILYIAIFILIGVFMYTVFPITIFPFILLIRYFIKKINKQK